MGRETGYNFKSSFSRKIILSGKLNVKLTRPWFFSEQLDIIDCIGKHMVFCWCLMHKFPGKISSLSVPGEFFGIYQHFHRHEERCSSTLAHFSKAENKSMFVITQPSLLKSTNSKLFSRESAKNDRRPSWKLLCFFRYNNVLYLSTKKSEICAISVPFNVIEMV